MLVEGRSADGSNARLEAGAAHMGEGSAFACLSRSSVRRHLHITVATRSRTSLHTPGQSG